MAGDDAFMSFDQNFSNFDSMFELSQNLAEKQNPNLKTVENQSALKTSSQKRDLRPTTMALKKRVTFQLEGNTEGS